MTTDYCSQAHTICIQLLARREYSQKELRHKLEAKGIPEPTITHCLDSLVEQGYQDDRRYAEMFCRTRYSQRYGAKKIAYELKQKGIDQAIIADSLRHYDNLWLENVLFLIERKAPRGDLSCVFSERKIKDKITRFLIGKGYDYATIQCAFETLRDEL